MPRARMCDTKFTIVNRENKSRHKKNLPAHRKESVRDNTMAAAYSSQLAASAALVHCSATRGSTRPGRWLVWSQLYPVCLQQTQKKRRSIRRPTTSSWMNDSVPTYLDNRIQRPRISKLDGVLPGPTLLPFLNSSFPFLSLPSISSTMRIPKNHVQTSFRNIRQ